MEQGDQLWWAVEQMGAEEQRDALGLGRKAMG